MSEEEAGGPWQRGSKRSRGCGGVVLGHPAGRAFARKDPGMSAMLSDDKRFPCCRETMVVQGVAALAEAEAC